MGKKKRVAAIMMMFLFAVVLFWKPNDVSAAARQVRLRANRTYKNYDITGNKKKDSIRVKTNAEFNCSCCERQNCLFDES